MMESGRSQPEFEALKAKLLRQKQLWEDGIFPAAAKSLTVKYREDANVVWMRPSEIAGLQSKEPKFVIEGATRFDLHQGDIGDCWFVAAVGCLAISSEQLIKRVVPLNQHFHENYAGIFRFNFWHFGSWEEVIVDDRLPTINGALIYGKNVSQPNEFWVPLIEKAYAKLKGGYESIAGGYPNNALVDFTGGISEVIVLKEKRSSPGDLFDVMYAMTQKCSMLSCSFQTATVPVGHPEPNGLYSRHAYSITNIVQVQLKSNGGTARLVRIRNPYGRGEWNGRWSDRSPEWNEVLDNVKEDIEMQAREEGEFWMSFDDFLMNFECLHLCHLEPDAVSEQISLAKYQTEWKMTKHESEWIPGDNAGGCGNPPHEKLFWRNPQFGVTISSSSPYDRDQVTHMVVSLMQESLHYMDNFSIGFKLYKVREGAANLLDGENYHRRALQLAETPHEEGLKIREVSVHSQLEPGEYVIIPFTKNPDEKTKFLLRVFTEASAQSKKLP